MTSATNGNGFACEPAAAGAAAEKAVPCPCCGGTLTPRMIDEIIAAARQPRDGSVRRRPRLGAGTMFIDPHAHMISRTTDDYEAMARAGVVAVIEPAFWLGQPRTNVGTYLDYCRSSSASSASAPASSASATTAPSASTRRRPTTRRWPKR